MRTGLYRHFDAAGALLYVGVSLNTTARLAAHGATSGWFSEIARVDVVHYPTRDDALAAERVAIETEKPRWNIKMAPAPAPEPTEPVLVRLKPSMAQLLDAWRRDQVDLPTRAEALRRLAAMSLKTVQSSEAAKDRKKQ